jgi:hypothetical protein
MSGLSVPGSSAAPAAALDDAILGIFRIRLNIAAIRQNVRVRFWDRSATSQPGIGCQRRRNGWICGRRKHSRSRVTGHPAARPGGVFAFRARSGTGGIDPAKPFSGTHEAVWKHTLDILKL